MVDKVRTAVFGKDQRVELKNYPLTEKGNKINITPTGEAYFMPDIGPNTFLDWPIRKRYLFFGPWVYKRTFIVMKKASKCIDFSLPDGVSYGPDTEALKLSNLNLLATEIGSETQKGIPWYIWAILGLTLLNLFFIMKLSGLFR